MKNIYTLARTTWRSAGALIHIGTLNRTKLLAKISPLRQGLQDLLKKIEPKFIRLGQKLQTIYADSKGLGQRTVKAAQSIEGGADDNLLTQVGRMARQSLEELSSSQKEIAQSLEKVGRGVEHLTGLHRMCQAIDKTAMVLHVVGLNIAVESCASLESRSMFNVFVEEIKQLSRKMNAIAQNIRNDSAQAGHHQLSAHREIQAGLTQLQNLSQTAEKTVADAMEQIRQLMALSFKSLEKAGAILKEISRQVGEIVVAIQFHDISRQQIEHIIEALRDLEKRLEGPTSDGQGRLERSRVLGRTHAVLLLQQEQLKTVIQEIENAHQKAENAFERIGIEILNLVETIQPGESGTVRGEKKADPFVVLQDGMENLQNLFKQGRDLGKQMEQIAGHASEAASTLTRHIDQVRGISMELHLKALNAIVKTAHLDAQGKTLEVLAHEVSRLSHESIGFVDQVVGVLESITFLAQSLAQHSWSGTGNKEAAETLTGGIKAVTGLYAGFQEDAQSVGKCSEELETSIRQIRLDLGFMTKLTAHLSIHLNALQELITGLSPWSADKEAGHNHEIMDLSRRYTMQKERDIHNHLFEKNGQEPPSPDVPAHAAALPPPPVEGSPEPAAEKKGSLRH